MAYAVATFLNEGSKIILVTSAYHMSRADKLFEEAGLSVTPFLVNFLSEERNLTLMSFIPSTPALQNTSFTVRELI